MLYQRIYVAGPYTALSLEEVERNVARAVAAAAHCMEKGHDAHCPHAATHPIAQLAPLDYERWMRLDFGILTRWATAILVLAPSPGVVRELAIARAHGLRLYNCVGEVEDLRAGSSPPRQSGVRSTIPC